jgi:hypothetical protein
MLRTVGDQPSLWESLLPAEALVMPAELVRVDALLDDVRFFEPYVEFFHASLGRPSIPIETNLRLMFLKYRYRLGFETLCGGGDRLDHVAAVLSHLVGWAGAASNDVDEEHHPLRALHPGPPGRARSGMTTRRASPAAEVAKLAELRDSGVISDAEFQQAKAKALS